MRTLSKPFAFVNTYNLRRTVRSHTPIYLSSYSHVCLHTALYLSSYSYMCVLILLYLYVSSYSYMCVLMLLYVSSYSYICFVMLLCMCSQAAVCPRACSAKTASARPPSLPCSRILLHYIHTILVQRLY